jgi:hypothetical protein
LTSYKNILLSITFSLTALLTGIGTGPTGNIKLIARKGQRQRRAGKLTSVYRRQMREQSYVCLQEEILFPHDHLSKTVDERRARNNETMDGGEQSYRHPLSCHKTRNNSKWTPKGLLKDINISEASTEVRNRLINNYVRVCVL